MSSRPRLRNGKGVCHQPQADRGRTYHLKVVADGPNLTVWVDGKPVIDAVDDTQPSGQFGMNVFNGTAVIQNVMVSGR